MNLFRKIVKGPVESFGSKVLGSIFWPPVSVAVLAESDHDDFLVLDADSHYELPGGIVKECTNDRNDIEWFRAEPLIYED
ncbi:hypothetical protein HRED_05848 [Candidatus Haloredivivus sp. G17]|nr:hypothetical protein HRED_05848 [Candidatus Haloredivivus sp. G17]